MAAQRTFLDYVEETTNHLETMVQPPQMNADKPKETPEPTEDTEPSQPFQFKPKPDMVVAKEVSDKLTAIWQKIYHKANFDKWLDIILAALERREEDYMKLIEGVDKTVLDAYVKMYSWLYNYFLDGYYGDPLGNFYQENFSHGMGGEFYTPWNIAYFMAQILNPKPDETIIDPCCGSSIMLLAARCVIHDKYGWLTSSRYGRNMYGMDISSRAVKMSKINLYLTDYVYMICLMQDVVYEFMQKQEQKVKN